MRVLHFGRFHGRDSAGIPRHVSELLAGLAERIEVHNLVANRSRRTERVEVDGYTVYQAGSWGLAAGTALSPAMIRLARELDARHRYDILHLHFPDPMAHLAVLALPPRPRKIVITWHSDILRQRRLLALYRPFLDRFLARAAAIFAPTPYHFQVSTQLGAANPARLQIIPFGLDYRRFLDPEAATEGVAIKARLGGRPIILSVGRHVYYKGYEYLIRSMAQVRQDALLLLGGTGPLTPRLKNLARECGLADRIIFTGHIPEAELPAHYHAADVFALPSVERTEAFGLAQLEAMACGKPVVCCELGNGVTWVNPPGVTGLAVPPREPVALAEAINTLLNDHELRQRLGASAQQRTLTEFSRERMVQATLDLYSTLLT
jgi:glycosyltransferase involved in cell wall biosynthesis